MPPEGHDLPAAAEMALQLGMLGELLAAISAEREVPRIADRLARDVKWIVRCDCCTVLLQDQATSRWQLLPADLWADGVPPGPIGTAIDRGTVMVLDSADARALDGLDPSAAFVDAARSAMVLPLEARGTVFGTLNLSSRQPGAFERASSIPTLLRLNVGAVLASARHAAELQRLNEEKTRLMATVSHDYRNPLTTISGYAELLMVRDVDADTRNEMLAHIRSEALRLDRMVAEIFDYSTSGAGRSWVTLNLVELVRYCVASVPQQKRVRIEPPASVPLVYGDRGQLIRVLTNLVENAVKYSPRGEPVTVTLGLSEDTSAATVAVADQGIGIDPSDLSTIFVPYARARTARQSGIRGTGLGLSIAREIVLAHGGKLWATSDGPGRGTTFWLALPTHHPD